MTALGAALGGLLGMVPAAVYNWALMPVYGLGGIGELVIAFLPVVLIGAFGAALGQSRLLRLRLTSTRSWLVATTAGGLLGILHCMGVWFALSFAFRQLNGWYWVPSYVALVLFCLLGPLGGVVLAALQRRALKLLPRTWVVGSGLVALLAVPATVAAFFGFSMLFSEWLRRPWEEANLRWFWLTMQASVALGIAVGWAIVALAQGALLQRRLAAIDRTVEEFS
jgi:hypothetical protein